MLEFCWLLLLLMNSIEATGFSTVECLQKDVDVRFRAISGQMFVLPCDLLSEDPPSIFNHSCDDNSQVQWSWCSSDGKTQQLLESKTVNSMYCGNVLWFKPIRVQDSGIYICRNRGKIPCVSIFVDVQTKKMANCSKNFRSDLHLIVENGESIACPGKSCYSNFCTLTAKWYKNGKRVVTQRKRLGLKLRHDKIILQPAYAQDRGIYVCDYSLMDNNTWWNMRTIVRVNVTTQDSVNPPIVLDPTEEKNLEVEVGQTLQLKCQIKFGFQRNASSLVQWYRQTRQKEELVREKRFSPNELGGETFLDTFWLEEVTEKDLCTVFVCLAKNSVGKSEGVFRLKRRKKTAPRLLTLCCAITILLGLFFGSVFAYQHWIEIVLLYRNYLAKDETVSDNKEFDAFVSYAKPDFLEADQMSLNEERFALEVLPEILENKYGYKLCLTERDILPGGAKEGSFAAASLDLSHGNFPYGPGPLDDTGSGRDERLHIFTVDFQYVQIPYEVTLWILLASLAKIGFHLYHRLPHLMPESCILIMIGALVGGIIFGTDHKSPPVMTTSIYFLYLLPPIVLEGGYFMPTRPFFENFGSILWWSALGSLINAFGIGFSIYGICQIAVFGLQDVNLLDSLLFGSMISAVDPAAILAVFEEMSVNEQLYMMIFGEALLNDGITVVLYNIFISFTQMHQYEDIMPIDILAGFARFFVVGLGGLLFGIVFGLVAAFATRFTQNISAIEPLLVFMFSYLSYLAAETVYISGILAITACAVTMKKYVEENVSPNSYTTIKYFMKMLSSISETLIFVFMGVSTIGRNHEWNWAFVCFTLVFCMLWRAISVLFLFYISNKFRTYRFTLKDQLIIIYSGVRGASTFSLAFLLPVVFFPRKKMFITSTIVVIYFTVFIQGITIRPLVKYLGIKKTNKKESINEEIHVRLMNHFSAGIEDICGHWSHYQLRDKFKKFDNRFLKKILIRKHQPKSSLVSLYKKMELKQVIEMVESGVMKPTSSKSTALIYRNQKTQRLFPEEVESMRNMLAHNLYQVRQRTLSYNRHSLADSAYQDQAKEIFIRRQHSQRQATKKGHSLPWGRQAALRNMRYLSLPLGNSQPARWEDRNDDLTGNDSSDSESVFSTLSSQPRSGSRKPPRQKLPLKQLHSRTGRGGLIGQERRANESTKISMVEKPLIPRKPRLNEVLENNIQENESEDETDRPALPSRPSVRWTADTRSERHFSAAKRHFRGRKE